MFLISGNSGTKNTVPDKDVLSNLAALSVILSHVNKGNNGGAVNSGVASDYPESPKNPNLANYDISGMKPPHRDAFWSTLYPIYHHLVNKGLAASSIIRKPRPNRPQSGSVNTFSDGGSGPEESFSSLSNGNYNFYTNQDYISITETPGELGDGYRKSLVKKAKKAVKKVKKKAKKQKKKINKGHHGHGGFEFFDPNKLSFGADFGIDILGTIKKKFYTLVALKLAPLIILTGLALIPLIIIVWPKILGWLKLGYAVYHHYKPKLKQQHHHGWHQGWNNNQYLQEGWKRFNGVGEQHHHFHGFAPPALDSLVQATYGDPVYRSANSNTEFDQLESSTDLPANQYSEFYDPELDTEHNRRVMEILMENKNATIHKLLQSWALERLSNSTFTTDPESQPKPQPVPHKRKRRRKKRNHKRVKNRK